MVLRKSLLPLVLALLYGGAGAGCPNEAIGPGLRTGAPARSRTGAAPGPDSAAARRALETLCDRMEDCAVERNVDLARAFGGGPADLEVARNQARVALHSGYVRRWCLLRLQGVPRPQLFRIHKCLAHTACVPFYRCADEARRVQQPRSARR